MKNTKGSIFITFFKLSHYFTKSRFLKTIGFPVRGFYKIFFEWILGIEIPDTTQIGSNLRIMHGQGLVVNSNTIIGDNVTLRHNTTIGNSKTGGGCPKIGNNVNIGANCVIIGDIDIGANSIIGAGSVVVKDVPRSVLVVGNPARVIKKLELF